MFCDPSVNLFTSLINIAVTELCFTLMEASKPCAFSPLYLELIPEAESIFEAVSLTSVRATFVDHFQCTVLLHFGVYV